MAHADWQRGSTLHVVGGTRVVYAMGAIVTSHSYRPSKGFSSAKSKLYVLLAFVDNIAVISAMCLAVRLRSSADIGANNARFAFVARAFLIAIHLSIGATTGPSMMNLQQSMVYPNDWTCEN
jgi:hypothetical protein